MSESSSQPLHICTDRVLPKELQAEARLRAMEENPVGNAILPESPLQPTKPKSGAVEKGKLWAPGRTLHFRFLDGDPALREKVATIAQEWTRYANIHFAFDDSPDAEIRISFRQPGSWSYVGTDALLIAADKPTMNFGWLKPTTGDEECSRVVLHEFGHMLGMIHEHQNPAAAGEIPWDREALMRYYMGPPNYWTADQVEFNIIQTYDQRLTNFTEFDVDSIMRYAIPQEHTVGDFEVPWENHQLSETDKRFIGEQYPGQGEGEDDHGGA